MSFPFKWIMSSTRDTRAIFNSWEEFVDEYKTYVLKESYNRIQNYLGFPGCNYRTLSIKSGFISGWLVVIVDHMWSTLNLNCMSCKACLSGWLLINDTDDTEEIIQKDIRREPNDI